MKIAVTSIGPSLDDRIEPRFGRCPYFILIDTETMKSVAIPNPNMTLGGGAGIQSAQMIVDKGVGTVLTGNCGPNAYKVFDAADIQVVTGVDGLVQDAVEEFTSNKLPVSPGPNVQDHFGMDDSETRRDNGGMGRDRGSGGGGGMGRCSNRMGGGRGRGRGMGMGRGRGMQTTSRNRENY